MHVYLSYPAYPAYLSYRSSRSLTDALPQAGNELRRGVGVRSGADVHRADLVVDFAAVDGHVTSGDDAQPHRAAADAQHAHLDAVADDDAFVELAGEDEHGTSGREERMIERIGGVARHELNPAHRPRVDDNRRPEVHGRLPVG